MLQRLLATNNRFVQLLATRSTKKRVNHGKREVFSQAARNSKEYIEQMKEEVTKQRLVKDKKVYE